MQSPCCSNLVAYSPSLVVPDWMFTEKSQILLFPDIFHPILQYIAGCHMKDLHMAAICGVVTAGGRSLMECFTQDGVLGDGRVSAKHLRYEF